jgi:putative transposase
MPRSSRIEYANAIHHVTQRGDKRWPVLERADDRRVYLSMLGEEAQRHGWRVLSYCLMPNHLHLLIRTPEPTLSKGMTRLNSRYARAYNNARDVPGHVFQGRFKNRLVESDRHLVAAFAYIAYNPVESDLCRHPSDWVWSAHGELVGRRRPSGVLAHDALDRFGPTPEKARMVYARYVEAFMKTASEGDGPATLKRR